MSKEENFQRIASSSRVTLGTEDLVDPGVLLLDRNNWDLFKFRGVEGLHLDVTNIDAEESARRIYQYARGFSPEGPWN